MKIVGILQRHKPHRIVHYPCNEHQGIDDNRIGYWTIVLVDSTQNSFAHLDFDTFFVEQID